MRLEAAEIRILVAVIEKGGFALAAQALGLSQPAISQSLASLENKLGSQLVERGRKPSLTRLGRRVYEHAVDQLRRERALLDEIDVLKKDLVPPLSVAVSAVISRSYLRDLLALFEADTPTMQLSIQEMPSRQIISMVLAGDYELGFGPFQTHMAAFDTYPLMRFEHQLVISQRHPNVEAIQAGDQRALAATRLIASYLDDPNQRPGQTRIRDYFSAVWQVNSLPLRLSLIRDGFGVGYLSEPLLRSHGEEDVLAVLNHSPFPKFTREVGLYHQRGRSLSPHAQAFLSLCEAQLGI